MAQQKTTFESNGAFIFLALAVFKARRGEVSPVPFNVRDHYIGQVRRGDDRDAMICRSWTNRSPGMTPADMVRHVERARAAFD